jgi:alpha-L-fucosidase
MRGGAEWIMNRCKIPVAEYQKYASTFKPVKYDPEAWVLLARQAGMKYIIITSKHHDGFAMFKSDASKFNIVDFTPYGKDIIDALAKACRKHNMKPGFYYGDVAVLWWDTPTNMTDEYALKLHALLKLQPNIITNDRLKRPNFPGDTGTPEQKIPGQDELYGKDWETCMTMNSSWGYKSYDDKWKYSSLLFSVRLA